MSTRMREARRRATYLPRCRQCQTTLGVWLRATEDRPAVYGYNGDGVFCTLRCGYAWAMMRVRAT